MTKPISSVAKPIPTIVVGRLPIYLRELVRLSKENARATTSSQELAQRLGISSAQIRKDLSHFGEFGKQGTGYRIDFLVEQLKRILHLTETWDVIVVGAGYLGHALSHYGGFQRRGFCVTHVFDNDPEKIGQQMGDAIVQDIVDLETVIEQYEIKLAILAVPTTVAQNITNRLIEAGIQSILTYTPIHLKVPEHVNISYSDPVVQLQQMTYYLPDQKK